MKRYSLLLLFITSLLTAGAQNKKTIYGYVKDSASGQPVPLASVTNTNTATTSMTNQSGRFRILISENQILSVAAIGYHFDTLNYNIRYSNSSDTLLILLRPLGRDLGNVTVTSKGGYSRYQLDSIERREEFLQNIVNYTIPTVAKANSGAGIALNLDRFSKHEKNKRRAHAFYENNEKEAYINYRFNTNLVSSLTGFRDEKLYDFMQEHRPTYKWLRQHTSNEDMVYYINDQLKRFNKNRATN